MKRSHLIPALLPVVLGVSALLSLAGCKPDPAQEKACKEFAAHLAEVVQEEQGEKVPEKQVNDMIEATVEKCLESPPKEDEMKCAMAASDLKTMKGCDPTVEEEAKKDG